MPATRPDPRWTLALVSAGGVMMTLDVTVVNVALSDMARDLRTGLDHVQWTVSVYSLAFGALLLTAGALSDRVGRRRVFVTGMALFTLSSAACGLAPDAASLIVARTAQGLGGSLVFAPTLALIAGAYEGARRQAAIATFAAVASAAGALGPVVGGLLVELLGWRWIFLVNVPIGVLVVCGALARMPETAPPQARRRLDPLGAALAVGALLALHFTLLTGPQAGWISPTVLAGAAATVALTASFTASQRHSNGLVDVALLRIRAFAGAAVLGFLARLTGLGVLAFLTLWLQSAYGYPPLEVGLRLLPLTGSLLLCGLFVARLQTRYPPQTLVAGGFAAQGLGLAALALAGSTGSEVALNGGLLLLGAGGAVIFPPLMGVAVSAVPADRAGMASGLTNACYPLGTATGVALFGALFSARLDSGLAAAGPIPASAREAVETGGVSGLGAQLQPLARSAVAGSFTVVCCAAALICLLGVLASRSLATGARKTGTAGAMPRRARTPRISRTARTARDSQGSQVH